MIKINEYKRKMKLPDCDYLLDKTDKFYELVGVLTPKFSGNWEFVLLDPKLTFCKELLEKETVLPTWINVTLLLTRKKLEHIVLQNPKLQPKEKSVKDELDDIIASLTHMITPDAKRAILSAIGANRQELQETLLKLDNECEGSTITAKQVRKTVNYTKVIYASDVLYAFLTGLPQRWVLYDKLLSAIGMEIAYYAMYKNAKVTLQEKQKYLLNEDVKNRTARNVDATRICYCYTLFANSNSYKQLPIILHCIENRSLSNLNLIMREED